MLSQFTPRAIFEANLFGFSTILQCLYDIKTSIKN
jgi:hypothetical protein